MLSRRNSKTDGPRFSRRQFVATSAAACATASLPPAASIHANQLSSLVASHQESSSRIWKTLKIGMTGKIGGTLIDKFNAAKQAGFDGIEMNSPGMSVDETVAAIKQTGLPVDGTVVSTHWGDHRHTNPDAAMRAAAVKDLETAIADTHAVGGNTALLVVGHGKDGAEQEIWPRAIENISKAIPLAARLGVFIAIENVWNHFLYDHNGSSDQTAEKYAKFVDELNSPWVGMQYDIGNHWKYGDPAAWIRTLGKRIVKLDVKGYSRAKQNWSKIGEGDIDWANVRAALADIRFTGWAAAEVGGGDLNRLKEISANLDKTLGLG